MAWQEVFSSSVDALEYDPESGTLLVQWKRGRISAYQNVPAQLAQQVATAYSVGSAIRERIIPFFEHRYL